MCRMWSSCIIFLLAAICNSSAIAGCLSFSGQNERLANFCLLESITGRLLNERTAVIVSQRLQKEGYFGGLSSPKVDASVYPTFFYSNNINGGNPDKNLVINDLQFEGDPTLVAKKGNVIGANFGAAVRSTYGEGRYFDSSLVAALNWSPEHSSTYSNGRLTGCLKNKIKRSGYADFCYERIYQRKEIATDHRTSITLNFGQLSLAKRKGFIDVGVGFKRTFYQSYNQNQVALLMQTIYPQNLFSSVGVRLGEPVNNQIAMNYGLDISLAKPLSGKPVTIALTHEYNDGGKLLGIERADRVNRISASVALNESLSISASYQDTRSSISYFSSKEPTISLTLTW